MIRNLTGKEGNWGYASGAERKPWGEDRYVSHIFSGSPKLTKGILQSVRKPDDVVLAEAPYIQKWMQGIRTA